MSFVKKQLVITCMAFSVTFLLFQNTSPNNNTKRTFYVSPNPIGNEISLSKLKTELQINCLSAGEKILFKRNSTFQGPLRFTICNSNTDPTNSVVISSYGTGSLPVIQGAEPIPSSSLKWELAKDIKINNQVVDYLKNTPIYKLGPLPKDVEALVYENTPMTYAQSPNQPADQRNTSYFNIESYFHKSQGCGTETCLTLSKSGSSDPTWIFKKYGLTKEAFGIVRTSDWSFKKIGIHWVTALNTRAIASHDSLAQPETKEISVANRGIIFFGSLAFLTQEKEWFYDTSSKYLYFWAPLNAAPKNESTRLIYKGSAPTLSIDFSNKAKLEISHLKIINSANNALSVSNVLDVYINGIDVSNAQQNGASFYKIKNNLVIQGSTFRSNAANGVRTSSVLGDIRIYGNHFFKNGYFSQTNAPGMDFNNLRLSSAKNISVAGNIFSQSAYAHIMTAPALNTFHVSKNTFKDFCLLLNDCGAVYVNSHQQTLDKNMWIEGNSFEGGHGNKNGSRRTTHLSPSIYLDYAGYNFSIYNNSFHRSLSHYGEIFINSGKGNKVFDNSFFQTHPAEITLGKTHNPNVKLSDNSVYKNQRVHSNGQRTPANYNFP